jgi:acetyltransferase-like isoleucine patch superfamily enzyme
MLSSNLALLDEIRYYTHGQASSTSRYVLQELVIGAFGWIPSLVGIGIRALAYRTIAQMDGFSAIEHGVRLAYPEHLRLGRNVYVDHGVYLHACPGGIEIGDGAFIMHNAELHVFNFRDLAHAFIRIGERTFVGESVIIRGQGGVDIGKAVLIGPGAQILAINHNHRDPEIPILDQGISCQGIVVEDGAWIGAGAMVLDGVRIGRNAVVGAGAVVTKDVPANCVAVGVPARIVESSGSEASQLSRLEDLQRMGRSGRPVPARVGRF